VQVQRADQTTVSVSVTVASVSPGLFSTLQQGVLVGAILHAKDFSLVTPTNPAVRGEYLAIYANGLGALQPPVPDGNIPPSPPPLTVAQPTVTIGGVSAPVIYSGAAAKLAAADQVNVQVPSGVPSGAQSVQLSISGISSNAVTLYVQ
jgi:uncharacterized protein (TIGR03437 family)